MIAGQKVFYLLKPLLVEENGLFSGFVIGKAKPGM
tara:strand:- start:130 stop:234 length:105 start_codon:yes stop_codon:yes gene_type:complete